MTANSPGEKPPLYDYHLEKEAKMVDFGGWVMPLQYSGIIDEAKATRNDAAIFDVSHMGEILIEGSKAQEFLQRLLSNDVSVLKPGKIQYTLMCNEYGGVIDDLLLYCLGKDKFWLVVNAANKNKDLDWIKKLSQDFDGVNIKDESSEIALIALQGPKAKKILSSMLDKEQANILAKLSYFQFEKIKIGAAKTLVSRTGYTGEDGFEIYLSPDDARLIWDKIMENGMEHGLKPAGLGARDVLRIEAGLPLYGQEISAEISPLEAGLFPFIKFETNFFGKKELEKQKEEGIKRKLTGFVLEGKRPPRKGYEIYYKGGYVGIVTSGTYSPNLEKSIGMGFISYELADEETEIEIKLRKKNEKASIINLPFIRRG